MIQIQAKEYTTGVAVKLMVDAAISGESGNIWYKLFDAENNIVTDGCVPVGNEFISNYDYSEIYTANYIANYLGVVIL